MIIPEISTILIIFVVWLLIVAIVKGYALYNAGKRKQLGWFVSMFIFNTAGILPAIYIILNLNEKQK